MDADGLIIMIIICIVSFTAMLGIGIAVIREDIAEIKNLIKNKQL